ncbi:MAG: GAF domain-containing protein, partial [Nodosilinea sp.]
AATDPQSSASFQLTGQPSAYIGTPIWVDGEIFGWLCFFAAEARPEGYQNHESEIIELMAQSIGKFISSNQVIAKRQQAEEAVQLLLNITQAMTAAPDFNQALYAALSALCAATGWIYGEVWLPSADSSVLECSPVWYCNQEGQPATAIAAVKQLRESLAAVTFQPNQGIAGRVWSRQQPEWTLAEETLAEETLAEETLAEETLAEEKLSAGFRVPPSDRFGNSGQAIRLGEQGQYRFQLVNHYGIKARLGVPITVTTDRGSVESAPSGRSTVLAVLVFFTAEARQQDERLIQLVSAVATQLGTVLAQKQAAAELQALFTAMNDVVLVRDAAGRCLKVASMNPSFEQPALQVLGKTLQDTLPQSAADVVLHGIQTSLANRSTVTLEYSLPLTNRQACLSASISPLSADTVLVVERDISDRKQMEEALARRERYLAALVEVQRALLAFRTTPSSQVSNSQFPNLQSPNSQSPNSQSPNPNYDQRDSQHQGSQGQESQYQEILRILAGVSAASHVYIYANQRFVDQRSANQLRLKLWARWDADTAVTVMPTHLYRTHGRWAELLREGKAVGGSTASFPVAEQAMLRAQGILAILLLPLMVNGKFWGFIGFDDCIAARPWDPLEVSLLRTAASAIALHHERSLIEDALRQSARREQATLRVIERMRQTLDIEQIFHTTVVELQALLQCDRVLIYRFNPDWSGEVVAEAVAQGWIPVMPAAPTDGLFAQVNSVIYPEGREGRSCILQTWGSAAPDGQPSIHSSLTCDTYLRDTQGGVYSQGAKYLSVPDVQQAGLAACYLKLLEQLQTRAYLTVPIFQGQQLWGLLAAYQNTGPRDWQPSEIRLVMHISTQFGVALQQSELLAQTQRQSAALEKAKDAAEAASRAKTQFLAHMSHELRTPLNSILGFTQLMSQDGALGQEHQSYLQIVNRSGQHLLGLINEVLDVARLEANRADLQINSPDSFLRGKSLE